MAEMMSHTKTCKAIDFCARPFLYSRAHRLAFVCARMCYHHPSSQNIRR